MKYIMELFAKKKHKREKTEQRKPFFKIDIRIKR